MWSGENHFKCSKFPESWHNIWIVLRVEFIKSVVNCHNEMVKIISSVVNTDSSAINSMKQSLLFCHLFYILFCTILSDGFGGSMVA